MEDAIVAESEIAVSSDKIVLEDSILNDSENNEMESENTVILESSKIEPTVRKLSLFDTLLDNKKENQSTETKDTINTKLEPTLEEADKLEDNVESEDEAKDVIDKEFSPESGEFDEDINQENDEELLDIPTFLRRQAN